MTYFRVAVSWLLLIGILNVPAAAHKPSDSYLKITGGDGQLSVEWDIALKDLEYVIGLDANQDGQITWGELKQKSDAITAHALSRLKLVADGQQCNLKVAELRVTRHSDGSYAVLVLETGCAGDIDVLDVEYDLLFDVDPTHRGLVLYEYGAVTSTHVLGPSSHSVQIRSGEVGRWRTLGEYVRVGVWHIWIGLDHILFLLSLLLPSVLVCREKRWHPVEQFQPACRTALKIVTVFTIAHSITLWLAVMEYVMLPSQFIEVTIAFSIVITALNNLYSVLPLSGWAIAFVFGLVHGFGFANVLLDLGLSSTSLAISLLGFNVGVELGQLAIVLAFVPLAFMLRRTWFYDRIVLRLGSVLIVIIASLWMYERLLNTTIVGF